MSVSSPAAAGDYVYVGSDNGTFYSTEGETRRVAWRYYVGVPTKSSPATWSSFRRSTEAFTRSSRRQRDDCWVTEQ